jgi:hypothetical protein
MMVVLQSAQTIPARNLSSPRQDKLQILGPFSAHCFAIEFFRIDKPTYALVRPSTHTFLVAGARLGAKPTYSFS